MGIRQEYVVECEAADCDEVVRCEHAETHQDAARDARAASWKLTRKHGWLCPYCQYMTAKG